MAEKAQCPSCKRELTCPSCDKETECPICKKKVQFTDLGSLPKHGEGSKMCVASGYTADEARSMLVYMRNR